MGEILGFPLEPSAVTRTFKCGRGPRSLSVSGAVRKVPPPSVALKMQEGTLNQGMQAASGRGKKWGSGFSLEPPEEMGPGRRLGDSPVRPISDFRLLSSNIINSCCFKPRSRMVTCYGSRGQCSRRPR